MLHLKMNFLTIILVFSLLVASFNSAADKEPNDSFDRAEELEDDLILGQVDVGIFEDVDIYKIEKKDVKETKLIFTLLTTGLIEIMIYKGDHSRMDNQYFTLQTEGKRKTTTLEWNDDSSYFYIQISGSGEYAIDVENSDDPLINREITIKTIILGSIFILLVVAFIGVSLFFIKVIQIRSKKNRLNLIENCKSPYENTNNKKEYSSIPDVSVDPYWVDEEQPDREMMKHAPGLERSIFE